MSIELMALAGAWLWDKYGEDALKSIAEKIGEKSTEKWKQFNWNSAAKKYRNALYEDYGKVRLLGTHESVELEGIFTDVFILDKVSAFQRHAIEELEKDPEKLNDYEQKRENGFKLIQQKKYKRWFILGKPGAGKTTFLKYITIQAVKGQLDKVPIFVSLHRWAEFVRKSADKQFNLMPYLVKQFQCCNFPDAQPFIEHLLETGNALLLFDGLDEVNQADDERAQMLHALSEFSREHRNCTVLLTCRVAAADYSLSEQFTYLEVADFTEEKVTEFVKKWFKQDVARGEQFLEEFARDEHRGLQELARVPILLTLLCLVYARKMEFPSRRADIYEEAIEALLETWDREHRSIKRDMIYQGLSKRHKLQLFSRIATESFQNNQYFFEKKHLASKIADFLKQLPNSQNQAIDGEAVLEAIAEQHGIFVERAKDIYSFAHLSFQEYFTARYIFENQAYGTIDNLVLHVTEDRWREVFLLTVSLLDNADSFFVAMQAQINTLIIDEPELVKLARWVVEKSASVQTSYKPAAVRGFYYFLARALDRALTRALARAIDLNRDLTRAISLSRARSIARALDRDSHLARALDRALARTLDLTFALDLAIDFKFLIIRLLVINFSMLPTLRKEQYSNFFNWFHQIIETVKQANLHELAEKLTTLAKQNIPKQEAPAKDWKKLHKKLLVIMQETRNIGHQWQFTAEQEQKLEKYLQAHLLLVDCLSLATVTDREAIENHLLLLPETNIDPNKTELPTNPLITHVKVKNFKSIVSTELELGQINVFIGANGAGKSNLLEALAFLSSAEENRLDPDTLYSKGIRIAKPSLMMSSFKEFPPSQEIELSVSLEKDDLPIQAKLGAKSTDNLLFHWEKIALSFDTRQIERQKRHFTYPPLTNYLIYNLAISALRGLNTQSKIQPLGINGEGLDTLLLNFSDAEKAELKEYSYFIEWLNDIQLDANNTYEKEGYKQGRSVSNLYFTDKFMPENNQLFSAENSNEGVLHILFYLALFISHKTPQFFAIDNIETSLNPYLCRHLMEKLTELAKKHRKQALITTHNPAILDGLDLNDEAVRLFKVYRDDEGLTQIRRIKTKPRKGENDYTKLSELWMSGNLGAIPTEF
ncbi:putative NTPase (NACHT family) [Beggiatoa alba B18LD]|uniref:Putative NTPase (NACHT family) n=1 Tax=Beggiatoa alba B18LD TaxID=395493 RepID=I3CJ39_9GAMM|nr:AAA family ATPase [Beggiatoa alba]EIJ43632.1 putative NTPase (NACHT family) [Beggiatoa alba B18LD]